jgi:hypothetical protein
MQFATNYSLGYLWEWKATSAEVDAWYQNPTLRWRVHAVQGASRVVLKLGPIYRPTPTMPAPPPRFHAEVTVDRNQYSGKRYHAPTDRGYPLHVVLDMANIHPRTGLHVGRLRENVFERNSMMSWLWRRKHLTRLRLHLQPT